MAIQRRAAAAVQPANTGVGRLLLRVARELRTLADRQLEPLGLTMQQAELLMGAGGHGGISPGQLTSLLLTDEAGVSRLVDRLETKGLVRRKLNDRDRRSRTLELTPAGRALVSRMLRSRARANGRLRAGIADADLAQLGSTLLRLSENMRKMQMQRIVR
jgi:DNA-binding MarR family transcriptional regulator